MDRRLAFIPLILGVVVAGLVIFVNPGSDENGGLEALIHGELADFELAEAVNPAPKTAFYNENGDKLTLADFKGRVVLVNLWATWCPPCLKEMPTLDALQGELGGDDFEVLAISVDMGGAEKSKSYLDRWGITHLNLYVEPSFKINREVEAFGLPATMLFDRAGNMVGRMAGPAEWDAKEVRALVRHVMAQEN